MQSEYIETPRHTVAPVKIDSILQQRMHAFMRARRVRRFTFSLVK
jgi:hypothetical protein